MANINKTIEILFAGNDKVSGTIDTVSGKLSDFGGRVEDITQPLANVADDIMKLDFALGVLALGVAAFSIKTAGEFNDSFSEISTLVSASDDNLNDFRQGIVDYAKDSGQSFQDINGAIYTAISAGTDYKESLDLLRDAEYLSIAGKAELNDTVKILASTLNAYGDSTDKAGDYSDILFSIVKDGLTTLPELNASLAGVTGIAAAGKVPFDDLGAAIAALTSAGLPTSQAMTGLKGVIAAMIDPSKQAADLADDLGIAFGSEALAANGLDGVLRDVYDATGGNIGQMATLFGRIEGLNSAVILGADASGKYADALDSMADRTGITSAAYDKMADNFAITNQKIANNIKVILIDVGDKLLTSYGGVAGGIIEVLQGIDDEVKAGTFDPFFDLLADFAEDISAYMQGIAKAMPEAFEDVNFEGLLDALGDLGGKIAGMFDGLDLTKPEDLQLAIQFVVDSLESLVKVTSGMAGPLGDFIGKIVGLIDAFNDLDSDTKEATGSIFGWGKVINTFIGPLGSFLKAVESLAIGLNVLVGIKVLSWIKNLAGISTITISAGLVPGIIALGSAITGVSLAVAADKLAAWLIDIGIKVPSGVPEFLETTQKEFDTMDKAIDEVNKSLDSMDFKQPVVDIKEMLNDPAFSDAEIQYAITGELSDLEAVLEEAGVLVKEKPVIVEAKTTEAVEKIEEVKKEIEEFPKELEIKLKGEIDKEIASIKSQGEVAQTAMEWTAKLNIAEAEADAKRFEFAIEGIASIIESTGDSLGTLFGLLTSEDLDTLAKWDIERQIDKESKMREDAHEAMMKLNDSQREYMEARTEALEAGEALIQITADGLEPEIAAFMYKILGKIQIRANEENAEFLLGI